MDGASLIFLLIPLLLIGMLIFQRRTMRRQAEQIQSQLALGVDVMTGSGVFGTVRALRDDHIELEIAPGVVTRWVRPAIARVVSEPAGQDVSADAAADDAIDDEADDRGQPPVTRTDGTT